MVLTNSIGGAKNEKMLNDEPSVREVQDCRVSSHVVQKPHTPLTPATHILTLLVGLVSKKVRLLHANGGIFKTGNQTSFCVED